MTFASVIVQLFLPIHSCLVRCKKTIKVSSQEKGGLVQIAPAAHFEPTVSPDLIY
jgi:hypothetical protein